MNKFKRFTQTILIINDKPNLTLSYGDNRKSSVIHNYKALHLAMLPPQKV